MGFGLLPPREKNTFVVISEDNEPEGQEYLAVDAESAAEKYAEYWDAGDYVLASDECATIEVEVVGPDGERKKFSCRAIVSVDYYADEVE